MQAECADNGLDWQEVYDQLQYEEMEREAHGLNPRIAESPYALAQTESLISQNSDI